MGVLCLFGQYVVIDKEHLMCQVIKTKLYSVTTCLVKIALL